jgi:hypothetical protein
VQWYKWKFNQKINILAKALFDHLNDRKENKNITKIRVKASKNLATLLRKNFDILDN